MCKNQWFLPSKTLPKPFQNAFKIDVRKDMQFFDTFSIKSFDFLSCDPWFLCAWPVFRNDFRNFAFCASEPFWLPKTSEKHLQNEVRATKKSSLKTMLFSTSIFRCFFDRLRHRFSIAPSIVFSFGRRRANLKQAYETLAMRTKIDAQQ